MYLQRLNLWVYNQLRHKTIEFSYPNTSRKQRLQLNQLVLLMGDLSLEIFKTAHPL